jgi:hypothetical protein
MQLSEGWLEWFNQDVFIKQQNIETVQVTLNQKECCKPTCRCFTGFVGEVWFEAFRGSEIDLCAWQALGTVERIS